MSHHPSEVLFEVKNLTKHFPLKRGFFKRTKGYVYALNRVSLQIRSKEILGIAGESGCGKSTLGRCAIKLIDPTEGQIFLEGKELTALKPRQMQKYRHLLQMVFQDPYSALNPRKTIKENLVEPLLYSHLALKKEEAEFRVIESLKQVGMSELALSRYPHQFSGGQQQRICIARTLSFKPKLIVCDEALSALDLSIQAQVVELLFELRNKLDISLLFISHDLAAMRHLCDRVCIMYLGEVIESGVTDAVFSDPKHPYTQSLIASIPKGAWSFDQPEFYKQAILTGEPPSPIELPGGCPFHPRCYKAKEQCSKEVAPYKKLVGEGEHDYKCVF